MKRLNIFFGLIAVWSYLFFFPSTKQVFAADCNPADHGISNINISPSEFDLGEEIDKVSVSFNTSQTDTPNDEYRVKVKLTVYQLDAREETAFQQKDDGTTKMSFEITKGSSLGKGWPWDLEQIISGKNEVHVYLDKKGRIGNWCKLGTYTINSHDYTSSCMMTLSQERDGKTCYYGGDSQCLEKGAHTIIKVTGLKQDGELYYGQASAKIQRDGAVNLKRTSYTINPGEIIFQDRAIFNKATSHTIGIFAKTNKPFCEGFGPFDVVNNCADDQCDEEESSFPSSSPIGEEDFNLCRQVPAGKRRTDCENCFLDGGLWTSLGCISNQDTKGIVDKIFTIGISLAGGIALLIILAAAFILSTSQGEPKRTSEAKEMLTHAIIGLLFIIFSITILEFVGVNILRIPEFGE